MEDTAFSLGDAVCLYSEDYSGFVCSLTSSTSYAGVAVRTKDDRVEPKVSDCQTIAFRLFNANRYKLQKAYSKLQEKMQNNRNDMKLKAEVAAAKEAADAEIEDNEAEQKRLRGKRVVYGQVIQLKHLFTGKLLHASSRNTAITESSNMQVFLSEVNDKTAHFRIMPRYKVKAEGDQIQVEDQIVLESIKTLGQYIHVSRPMFGSLLPIYEKNHELNISVRSSGFTIYRHYKWKESEENQLKAGLPVRLFHMELEAYLVADGVFGDDVTEEVHLRVRNHDPNNPRTLEPPTSAISYWQLELKESVVRGDVVKWQQAVRFKHMCTQQYLIVDKNKKVGLTTDHSDPLTVFKLHPVIKARDEIEADTFCRISHVVTGLWLSGTREEYKSLRERKGNDKSPMASLKWSTAVLKQISVKEEMQYDDAFTLQPVEAGNLANFNFMAGIVPIVQMIIKMASSDTPINPQDETRILTTMKEVRQFMVVNGEPSKRRQKLLRNLQVVELLVRLLQRPIRGSPNINFLTKVFLEAYDVLHAYLLGDSRKNELYMAKHIEFFQKQIDLEGEIGLNAAYMVTELVRDNRKLVDRIPKSYIDDIINVMTQRKHERYLNFLEILCVCDGMNVPDNQRYICEKWLMSDKNCVFYTDVGQAIDKEKDVVYVSMDKKRTWITLREFAQQYKAAKEENKDAPSGDGNARRISTVLRRFGRRRGKPTTGAEVIKNFRFLENQLQLFGKLCQGRNEFCIDVITVKLCYLTWEEAFICLSDPNLPEDVRANYCDVIVNLFIDVGDQTSVLDNISLAYVYDDIPNRDNCQAASKTNHASIDETAERHIELVRRWIAKFLDEHKDMTASLVGENRLICQVLHLLQYLIRFGYYNRLSDLKMLIGPLLSLTDGRNDKPCPPESKGKSNTEFMRVKEYYQTHERYKPSVETKAIVDAKLEAMAALDLIFNFRANARLLRFVSEFKHIHDSAQQISGATDLAPLLYETYDMSVETNTNSKARRVLEDIFAESSYFENTDLISIVMDLSNYEYDEMVRNSMWLLYRDFSAHSKLFERAVQAQVLITDKSLAVFRMLEREMQVFRRLATSRMSDTQVQKMNEILDIFISICHLEDNPMEPHPMNQSILYNHGILRETLDLVTQDLDAEFLKQNPGMKKVIEKSFQLLRLLAVGNPIIQKRLFDRLDSLLTVTAAVTYLAETLTEVFTGNKETCMKILPFQIRAIMDHVAANTHNVPQLLDLLNAVVKVEELNLPLKRNQAYVMTYFMQLRSEIAYPLDVPLTEIQKQLHTEKRTNEVIYVITLVDLLATCAEGENRYIESINQTIFSYQDLLTIINDSKICNHYKKAFIRFLLWVYLNTAGGLAESGADEMAHSNVVWEIFDKLAKEVKNVNTFSQENPQIVRTLLRKAPTIRDSLEVNKSETRDIHETLFYYLDAVLPLLHVYFNSCFDKDPQEHPNEVETLNTLATNFIELADTILSMMDNVTQVEDFTGAIRSMLSASSLPQHVIEDFQDSTKRIQISTIESDERKSYNEYYAVEEELNRQLNVFSVNFNLIYGGENTVAAQIGYDSSDEYTEIDSDIELPLGEEFQKHIACFLDENAKTADKTYYMASKLVEQLHISNSRGHTSEKSRKEQEELDICCLQLLRGMVHNAKVQLPKDDGTVTLLSKSYLARMGVLREVQSAINSHNAILRILPLLSKPSDDIVREVLAFLVDILYGGNIDVQGSLYAYFVGTREERFFFAIRNRMQLSSVAYKEKRILSAQHQAKIDEALEQIRNLQRAMKQGAKMDATELMKLSKSTSVVQMNRGSTASLKKRLMGNSFHGSQKGSSSVLKTSIANSADHNSKLLDRNAKVHPIDLSKIKDDEDEEPEEIAELEEVSLELPSDLDFKDDGYVELVLRLLAYMCDGQNKNIQDYLREQPDNIKSVNIIAEVPRFLSVVYTSINFNSLPLLVQIFDTLVEFGSGNKLNQAVIHENKICDYMNFILRSQKQMTKCGLKGEYQLKLSIGQLIFILIEENTSEISSRKMNSDNLDEANNSIAYNMMISLDADIIKNTFVNVYNLIQENKDRKSKIDSETLDLLTVVGFRYFHILLRLMDLDYDKIKVTKERLVNVTSDEAAWQFFEKQTKSVEILKDDVLQKVYFYVKDESILRAEIKESFKYEVDRASPSSKLRDLVGWSKEIIEDIKYQRRVTSNFVGAFLVRGWFAFNMLAILLSVVIAIVIMVSWNANPSAPNSLTPVQSTWAVYTLLGLSIAHNVISFFTFISFFLSNHVRPPTRAGTIRTMRKIFTFGLYTGDSEEESSKIGVDLFSFRTFYYIVFFGLSLGGTFTYGYLFAFHLLHIAGFNQLLKRVIQAVTRNGMSLIWVFVYSLTIFYIYALASFAFFRPEISTQDGNYCNQMWSCFIAVIHRGLVFGLYDSSFVIKPTNYAYSWYLGKFFFDLSSFIILTTIGLNIIFGIIVDTFSELRDNKWSIDNDIASNCFVCSRSSHDFEHHPGGFENHIKHEHNEWAYLFYFIHLDETQRNDYTGIEMFVAHLFIEEYIDFFPINRSLSLQLTEEDNVEQRLANLESKVDFLVLKKQEREALKAREEEYKRQLEWEKMHRGGGGGGAGTPKK